MPDAERPQARAGTLLRHPKLWVVPAVLSGLPALLLSLLYMGGIVNPKGDLKDLPIAFVNSDIGEPSAGQEQNVGTQIARSVLTDTSTDTAHWRALTRSQAQDQLDSGKVYGALVIPADFTDRVAALTTTGATEQPTITVLTNPGKGSIRAILYFDARGDAGLSRAWWMTAIGAAIGILFGFAMTIYYDRKGHKRLTPQPE